MQEILPSIHKKGLCLISLRDASVFSVSVGEKVQVVRGMQIGNRQMTEMAAAVHRARALERSRANVSEVTGI